MKKILLATAGFLAVASPAVGMQFPECDSNAAKVQVQEVVDRSTLFRPFYVIRLFGAADDGSSGLIRFCHATAILSDGTNVPLMFTFRIDLKGTNQYVVHVQVAPKKWEVSR
jgi:hypothetical protein